MLFLMTTVLLLTLVSSAASQCTGNDDPACPSWIKNGYCTNTASPMDTRKLYCGVGCGFCNPDGTQTEAGGGPDVTCSDNNANCASWAANNFCTDPANSEAMKKQYCCKTCSATTTPTTPKVAVDGNANCEKWSKDPANAFCASDKITLDQKKTFCAKTCEFEITPTADCAIYTVTGKELTRGTPVNATKPAPAVVTGASATIEVSRVYVRKDCTVELFTDTGAQTEYAPNPVKFLGTATATFFPVDPLNKDAGSFTCVC